MRKSTRTAVTLIGLGLGAAFAAHGQTRTMVVARSGSAGGGAQVVDARWKESLDAFAAADREHAPVAGGVLFVGSSSIRLWSDLEKSFEAQPAVLKRGFGGSRLSDCAAYVEQLVLPYAPKLVVVYAGDNDLAEGATPQEVRDSFALFVDKVRAALPNTRIAYMSIKPSPLRAALMPQALEANAMIEAYTRKGDNLDYIDVYSRMLGADGNPRLDLFQADRLHLNADGYAIWKTVINEHLKPGSPIEGAPLQQASATSGGSAVKVGKQLTAARSSAP